jgi:hypothetical protein
MKILILWGFFMSNNITERIQSLNQKFIKDFEQIQTEYKNKVINYLKKIVSIYVSKYPKTQPKYNWYFVNEITGKAIPYKTNQYHPLTIALRKTNKGQPINLNYNLGGFDVGYNFNFIPKVSLELSLVNFNILNNILLQAFSMLTLKTTPQEVILSNKQKYNVNAIRIYLIYPQINYFYPNLTHRNAFRNDLIFLFPHKIPLQSFFRFPQKFKMSWGVVANYLDNNLPNAQRLDILKKLYYFSYNLTFTKIHIINNIPIPDYELFKDVKSLSYLPKPYQIKQKIYTYLYQAEQKIKKLIIEYEKELSKMFLGFDFLKGEEAIKKIYKVFYEGLRQFLINVEKLKQRSIIELNKNLLNLLNSEVYDWWKGILEDVNENIKDYFKNYQKNYPIRITQVIKIPENYRNIDRALEDETKKFLESIDVKFATKYVLDKVVFDLNSSNVNFYKNLTQLQKFITYLSTNIFGSLALRTNLMRIVLNKEIFDGQKLANKLKSRVFRKYWSYKYEDIPNVVKKHLFSKLKNLKLFTETIGYKYERRFINDIIDFLFNPQRAVPYIMSYYRQYVYPKYGILKPSDAVLQRPLKTQKELLEYLKKQKLDLYGIRNLLKLSPIIYKVVVYG